MLVPRRLHPPVGFMVQLINHNPLGFEAKPRNHRDDFVGQITAASFEAQTEKSERVVLRSNHKIGSHQF
jgi:hypothetical protein